MAVRALIRSETRHLVSEVALLPRILANARPVSAHGPAKWAKGCSEEQYWRPCLCEFAVPADSPGVQSKIACLPSAACITKNSQLDYSHNEAGLTSVRAFVSGTFFLHDESVFANQPASTCAARSTHAR